MQPNPSCRSPESGVTTRAFQRCSPHSRHACVSDNATAVPDGSIWRQRRGCDDRCTEARHGHTPGHASGHTSGAGAPPPCGCSTLVHGVPCQPCSTFKPPCRAAQSTCQPMKERLPIPRRVTTAGTQQFHSHLHPRSWLATLSWFPRTTTNKRWCTASYSNWCDLS